MKQKFYRWLAKWRLTRRYLYLNEVNRLMEEYLTSQIIGGGQSEQFLNETRRQLASLQNENRKQDSLIKFLQSL